MRKALIVWPLVAGTGCVRLRGPQHMLDTAGPQAERIAQLYMLFFAISAAVFVAVIAVLALAVRRGRRRVAAGEEADQTPATERRLTRRVGMAAAATLAILLGHLVASVGVGRALSWPGGQVDTEPSPPLTIKVVGHQWWWEVRYLDPQPSRIVTTANELHIPVGRPVRVMTESRDVIHSFWAPKLHGKQDIIPGYENTIWLQADRPGVFRGQCAEFCGQQHALMAFDVIAEPEAQFNQWYEQQLAPAPEPSDSSLRAGKDVFMNNRCVMCHAIGGTEAGSNVGPDLTHFASRRTIAAGTLPNTRGNLAGWIVDPQRIKPGTRMPSNELSPDDLNALLDYLRSLR